MGAKAREAEARLQGEAAGRGSERRLYLNVTDAFHEKPHRSPYNPLSVRERDRCAYDEIASVTFTHVYRRAAPPRALTARRGHS